MVQSRFSFLMICSRAKANDPQVAHIVEGERKLFGLRSEARNGQKAQLRERTAQLKEQVRGLTEQIDAKGQEIALIEEELKGVLELWKKQLVSLTRVTSH